MTKLAKNNKKFQLQDLHKDKKLLSETNYIIRKVGSQLTKSVNFMSLRLFFTHDEIINVTHNYKKPCFESIVVKNRDTFYDNFIELKTMMLLSNDIQLLDGGSRKIYNDEALTANASKVALRLDTPCRRESLGLPQSKLLPIDTRGELTVRYSEA